MSPVARRRLGAASLNLVLLAGLALPLLPLLWTLSSSFKDVGEIFRYPPQLLPPSPSLEHYEALLRGGRFLRWFANSVVVGAVTTAVAVGFSALGGFAFAKYEFRGKRLLFNIVLGSMMIPFAALLIPLFVITDRAGLTDSLLALIVPWVAPAYGVFLMRQYIVQSVPNELLDAGRIDGATEFGVFRDLVVPLVRPALGALSVWTFITIYNNFLWPLTVISSDERQTLPVGIAALYGNYQRQYGLVMAAAVLTAVPMIALFVALRRQFIEGLTIGALKG